MNITKRRRTNVVGRDKLRRCSLTPLLETKHVLQPEYEVDPHSQLYELTLKKRRDQDAIPVPVALFGNFNHQFWNFSKVIKNIIFKFINNRKNFSSNSSFALLNIWKKIPLKYVIWVRKSRLYIMKHKMNFEAKQSF